MKPAGSAGMVADGAKYYIGNANAACMVSVLAKQCAAEPAGSKKRSPFVFFAIRPREAPAYGDVRKIRTLGVRAAFVGQFEVKGHELTEDDVIARGRDAWDAAFGTVDFGKFFLGFGSIGICAHAFTEAADHLHRRVLYGKPVAEMPHIRTAMVTAFARLVAMKLYAYRALDYLHVSGKDDRRYLLFNAVQKARVSTEGVKVLGLLAECVGARGVEAETYLEMAVRDAQLIPSLEGSTHINFTLTAQFIGPYFAPAPGEVPAPESVSLQQRDCEENPYGMEAHDRNAKTVRFAHFLTAYEPLRSLPNVRTFVEQVEAFGSFVGDGASALNASADAGLVIEIGKCFSTIVFAQLIAENCLAAAVTPATVSVIFHALIEDFSVQALKLSAMFPPESNPRALLKGVVRVPETSTAEVQSVAELIAMRYAGAR